MFKALAHPARIRALEVLAEGDRSVSAMLPFVGIESSHLSQQLGVLRRAGLVATHKEGSSVIYSLKDPLVGELLLIAKRFLLKSIEERTALGASLSLQVVGR